MRYKTVGKFSTVRLIGLAAIMSAYIVHAGADPAAASRYRETRTITVTYGDLDLSKTAGIEKLYQRLKVAARNVCGSRDVRDLNAVQDWRRCYRSALAGAVRDVGNTRLSALHEGQEENRPRAAFPIAGLP